MENCEILKKLFEIISETKRLISETKRLFNKWNIKDVYNSTDGNLLTSLILIKSYNSQELTIC